MVTSVHSDHFTTFPSLPAKAKRKVEPCPGCDSTEMCAAVPLDNLLADRQPDAGAGELLPLVQPLEHAEDPLEVLRSIPRPLSLHRKQPFLAALPGGGDMHVRDFRAVILDARCRPDSGTAGSVAPRRP